LHIDLDLVVFPYTIIWKCFF